MRSVRVFAAAGLLVLLAGLAAAAPAAASPAAPAARAMPQGTCYPTGQTTVRCVNQVTSPGAPGSGGGAGGGGKIVCMLTPLTKAQVQFLGLSWPAPKGQRWEAVTCPGKQPFSAVTLVSTATGAPAISPQQLMQTALSELHVPALTVRTAPPRGHDGLVGLPEWFWVSAAQWHRVLSPPAVAGPVWAQVIATPAGITVTPGAGLPPVRCAGPGAAYRPGAPSRSGCTYSYQQSSAGQPGNAYRVSVTVTWTISWTGSGGAGGIISRGYQTTASFGLPVAEGQALVTGSSP